MRTSVYAQRVVHLPAEHALQRLSAQLEAVGTTVSIDVAAAAAGSMPRSLRFPLRWVDRTDVVGRGHLEVLPLSEQASQVEVCLHPPNGRLARIGTSADASTAHALAGELRRRLERPRASTPGPARPQERRRAPQPQPRLRRLIAVGTAGALAAVMALALPAMISPTPVTLDTATARYREASAASSQPTPLPLTVAAPTGLPAEHGAAARSEPATEQARQATPGQSIAPPPAAEPPPAPTQAEAPAPEREPEAESAPEPEPEPAVAAPTSPEPGVYRYATEGWEELSMPGSRRSFPAETTQTVHRTDCGHRARWDPMEERSDELTFCDQDGTNVLAAAATYREFFGHGVEQDFHCRPAGAVTVERWTVHCESEDSTMTVELQVLGTGSIRVGSESVDGREISVVSTLDGSTRGTRRARSWVAMTGLLLRSEVSADLELDGPFGTVRYREEHRLELLETRPRR